MRSTSTALSACCCVCSICCVGILTASRKAPQQTVAPVQAQVVPPSPPATQHDLHETDALKNIHLIVLDIFSYTINHDDTYPHAALIHQDLSAYAGPHEAFYCPDTRLPITFNQALQGVKLAAVENNANTVMLYEGRNGIMDFHHQGRAAVAMADGSCRYVTEEEAQNLKWEP